MVNPAAAYGLALGNAALEPELDVDSVFNTKCLYEEALFVGASVGPPERLAGCGKIQ